MAVAISVQRHSSPARTNTCSRTDVQCTRTRAVHGRCFMLQRDASAYSHTHTLSYTAYGTIGPLLSNAHSRIMRPYLKLALRLSHLCVRSVCCVWMWVSECVCAPNTHTNTTRTQFKNVCSVFIIACMETRIGRFIFLRSLVRSWF